MYAWSTCPDGRGGVIKGNQDISKKCYVKSLQLNTVKIVDINNVSTKARVKPRQKFSTKEGLTNPDEEISKYA